MSQTLQKSVSSASLQRTASRHSLNSASKALSTVQSVSPSAPTGYRNSSSRLTLSVSVANSQAAPTASAPRPSQVATQTSASQSVAASTASAPRPSQVAAQTSASQSVAASTASSPRPSQVAAPVSSLAPVAEAVEVAAVSVAAPAAPTAPTASAPRLSQVVAQPSASQSAAVVAPSLTNVKVTLAAVPEASVLPTVSQVAAAFAVPPAVSAPHVSQVAAAPAVSAPKVSAVASAATAVAAAPQQQTFSQWVKNVQIPTSSSYERSFNLPTADVWANEVEEEFQKRAAQAGLQVPVAQAQAPAVSADKASVQSLDLFNPLVSPYLNTPYLNNLYSPYSSLLDSNFGTFYNNGLLSTGFPYANLSSLPFF